MALSETTIEVIADLLKDPKDREPKLCLLIGAGVSYTAGIGLAGDFVERIKTAYPQIYGRACADCAGTESPGYAQCMSALPPAKQVELVRHDIDHAKINWAHIGIARMERGGFVDTILTPNFDPLASRACALFNRFPAIYDLAGLADGNQNIANFDRSFVKGSAIFHMHGQHTGFILLNTTEKLRAQAERMRSVLNAVMKGKPVIIAGYSGENDPLVDEIAALAPFNHGLYWVCHDDKDPADYVREKLLSLDDCHIVRNMPADKFFTELANALGLEAPGFLASPFAHMKSVLDTIKPYADVGDKMGEDLLEQAKGQLAKAAKRQTRARPEQTKITTLFATGKYQSILDQYLEKASVLPDDDKDNVAWAAIMIGNALSDKAKTKQNAEADGLFAQASEKYAAALMVKPDMHEALFNWGVALCDQAKTNQGAKADILLAQAGEKYAEALAIKPNDHEALTNWGIVLSDQAKTKQGAEAEALNEQAKEKYAAALANNPDDLVALTNWGIVLSDQAKTKQGAEADVLFEQAGEKHAAALEIEPDYRQSLNSWGIALSDQARTKQGAEADALFAQAGEKYAAALEIKPDYHEALNNWGIALSDQAKTKQGAMADILFARASEKFTAALAINADDHETLNNWGVALSYQAETKQGAESEDLFARAGEKFAAALAIKPDKHGALFNWGIALSDQAKTKQGAEAEALFARAGEKYAAALAIKPDDYDAFNNWGADLSGQATTKQGAEADALFAQALEKLNSAEALMSGSAAYNLACLFALQNKPALASDWLRKSYKSALDFPDCAHVAKDSDFNLIRHEPEFLAALADIGCM